MALVDIFKAAVAKLLSKAKAGGVTKTVTFHRVAVGTYDPATDDASVTTTDYTVDNAFVYALSDQEVDWFIGDSVVQKCIIEAAKINNLVPATEDYLTIEGEKWEIVRKKRFPGDPMFLLYVRLS